MAEVDPDTLLEWLSVGQSGDRDIQLLGLEQLCMLLLMSDNVDKCFEAYVATVLIWNVCLVENYFFLIVAPLELFSLRCVKS